MIRNIVFDMGMVLLEYDPVKVCWEYTDNPEDVEWMRRELFDSKEWSLLDEGTLTDAQALERVQKRLPNEHLRWLAKESLEHWHEYNIWAKPAIYERLFEKFHLKAEECFFIDDRQDNIDSAKGCGMDGYCFADGNVERLRAYMGEMEIV